MLPINERLRMEIAHETAQELLFVCRKVLRDDQAAAKDLFVTVSEIICRKLDEYNHRRERMEARLK